MEAPWKLSPNPFTTANNKFEGILHSEQNGRDQCQIQRLNAEVLVLITSQFNLLVMLQKKKNQDEF